MKSYDTLKRFADFLASVVALIITAPIQVTTAVVILAKQGHPILFRQRRPGLDGRAFELIKFRTMLDADQHRKTDAERLTKLGKVLRATSLDELPTLWNVLKGDMSFVGPRPLLIRYMPRYTKEQTRRHEVRPGITGLSQVMGRNSLPWDTRLKYDVEYVDRRSAGLDVTILLKTVWVVVSRQGVNEDGEATMSEFFGSNGMNDG